MNNTLNQLLQARKHLKETERLYVGGDEDSVNTQRIHGNLLLRLDKAILKQIGLLLDAVEDA